MVFLEENTIPLLKENQEGEAAYMMELLLGCVERLNQPSGVHVLCFKKAMNNLAGLTRESLLESTVHS